MSEMNAIYRVKQYILKLIRNGELENGSKLPSNLSIARALNVKTDDVYDGIDELITEQIVTDNFEEGTSVKTKPPFYYPLDKIISISTIIEEAGYKAGIEYLNFDEQPATILDAEHLDIEDKQPITIIERLRTANHKPVVFCLDKIAKQYLTCSDYQQSNGSMLEAIKKSTGHEVTHAEMDLEAISYEPHISEVLSASPHEGLMLLKVVHYDEKNQPILYSLNYIKSSLVKFTITKN
ncbi:GntR family transcriptional regulator [Staphylococcus saccharolyticus]|uniref:GntR family transcriptional regulator n=1 Tax=Staphylococcus saccharolyticus TaxID=33028 RepID=UPI00102E06A9|nr:GntR family transcriptional regulator [Staphylococcus saccharolyticus]MBL7573088.1 GntR family transcriptional regulator [Staphylococcus saccharolyticus]MBL7583978.1 GntR family transcriptional regulator [Staphylococcus saccharolyticus]MBL7638703.1 GntR family transcriptional regulator [Staphylococcus saccharolyticus]QRJ67804.1 GntR family transcriptional regulator [Staphylococcus saccharolyticus]TAA93616.1 transcriptional regulator [Staphylococcus saccharolyticus]